MMVDRLMQQQENLIKQMFVNNGIDMSGMTKGNVKKWFLNLKEQGWSLKPESMCLDGVDSLHTKHLYILLKDGVEVDSLSIDLKGRVL